jgi:hypothetical protein
LIYLNRTFVRTWSKRLTPVLEESLGDVAITL